MDGLAHQITAGIATGGIYASVALALVMIYQATHHVNFAQGEMATFSTYIALTFIQAGLPYWVAFVATVVVSFAIGVAIERLLMRPVQHAPVLTHVGVFIGLLLIVGNATGWVFGYTTKVFPSPFESEGLAARRLGVGARAGLDRGDARGAAAGLPVLPPHHASASPCAPRPTTPPRRGWSASASAGCWRSAGGSPRRSARWPG